MASRIAAVVVTALVCFLAAASGAAAHKPRCTFPKHPGPAGDPRRVWPIPHGCEWLRLPADPTRLPIVRVRQHDARGRWVDRSFPVPRRPLASDTAGICGFDSTYLFFVSYPFSTIVVQELFLEGDRLACWTDFDRALLWTLQLSPPPRVAATWFTHEPRP